ncbi:MAG: signal peptidase II [Candidatus Omnitrophica bacterium]|nr:signal peptidase II [Candidatus Omnitrophota bacterium]
MTRCRPWHVAAAIGIVDQLTKAAVRAAFQPSESRPIIEGVFHFTYVQNTGSAFGLFRGAVPWLIAVSVLVGWWVVVELRRPSARSLTLTTLAWALVLGGAAGNLLDRVRWGYVVDFVDLRVWPVFNVADSAITVGVGLLLWRAFREKRPQSTDHSPR